MSRDVYEVVKTIPRFKAPEAPVVVVCVVNPSR
jgi:hypothetical protein